MLREDPNNPGKLRLILGDKLRHLAKGAASISKVCRQIGVNRTQFNRYLSGNAFPRPDVLHRICTHFDVDTNILQRRIAEYSAPLTELAPDPVSQSLRSFDHYLLPDAMYQYWRRSFRQPEHTYLGLALIHTPRH